MGLLRLLAMRLMVLAGSGRMATANLRENSWGDKFRKAGEKFSQQEHHQNTKKTTPKTPNKPVQQAAVLLAVR